jgi:hypothetical protein
MNTQIPADFVSSNRGQFADKYSDEDVIQAVNWVYTNAYDLASDWADLEIQAMEIRVPDYREKSAKFRKAQRKLAGAFHMACPQFKQSQANLDAAMYLVVEYLVATDD